MMESPMRELMKTCFVAAVLCCSITTASADPDRNESGKSDKHDRWKGEQHKAEGERNRGQRRRSYFHDHGYARLDIPKGHYPPPGECRIWFPDRPAGHQPPPGSCG